MACSAATSPEQSASSRAPTPARRRVPAWRERIERFVSSLSTRNNFWQKLCSFIWLPYAFFSGITMKRIDPRRFTAVLPFRRFNRNWYRAMAGAALLGNCEVAAGMYLFSQCGSDYLVVCKEVLYRFLRPCRGPAIYHVVRADNLAEKLAGGEEFNVTLDMDICQQVWKGNKELRVGRCTITFHCTPREHASRRATRRASAGPVIDVLKDGMRG